LKFSSDLLIVAFVNYLTGMYFVFYVCKCCNHLLNLLIVAFDNYLTENFGEIMMADADFNMVANQERLVRSGVRRIVPLKSAKSTVKLSRNEELMSEHNSEDDVVFPDHPPSVSTKAGSVKGMGMTSKSHYPFNGRYTPVTPRRALEVPISTQKLPNSFLASTNVS